jgi:hypothetical protein
LIEKAHWFVLNCTNWELVTHGFQIYECLFECPHLAPEIEILLRESIYEIHKYFLKIEDQSCIVFACFGRLLGKIIQSLKIRNCIESVELWFPIMREMVRHLKSISFIHLTPQRTLEGLTFICPMPEETLFKVVGLLMEFAILKDQPYLCDYVGFVLTAIYENEFPNKLKIQFVVACTPIFHFQSAESFMKSILAINVYETGEPSAELFSALAVMEITCPSLECIVDTQLMEFFDKGSREDQIAFITRNKRKFEFLIGIWSDFFDQSVYENCFDAVLQNIGNIMSRP